MHRPAAHTFPDAIGAVVSCFCGYRAERISVSEVILSGGSTARRHKNVLRRAPSAPDDREAVR